MSIDQQIDRLIKPLAQGLSEVVFYEIPLFGQGFPIIVMWLVAAALFFTAYLGLS
jgi:AGCS family alanine or glycine:cation symporter